MRLPPWLFLVSVIALVVATAFCSVGAYAFAQQTAIQLGSSGIQVASFADFQRAQPTPPPTSTRVPPLVTTAVGTSASGANAQSNSSAIAATSTAMTMNMAATMAAMSGSIEVVPVGAPTAQATEDVMAGYSYNDPRRLNILVLGIDQRTGETGSFRTDTLIVVSIDPVRKTIGMLSIPRDLYVPIPGFTTYRINTANSLGDDNAYPGGGPALAARTITENLGIPIDRYIRINFDVFTRVVDLIAPNGVEVCPPEVIDDQSYPDGGYGTIVVHFDPGCQRLDSTRLLQYARTRHTQGSDFDRSTRQQEVIKALRDEVLSAGGIANFITRIPALYQELAGSYVTDFATLDEILNLATLIQEVPSENIRSGVINNLYVSFSTTAAGEEVLIPNYSAIRSLIQDVFNPLTAEMTLDDLRQRAEAENATIVVYNNTSTTGLAAQMRDWLAGQGVTITAVGNTQPPTNTQTLIRDYNGSIWTARYLAALMGLPPERVQPGADGATSEDVMVVVGTDATTIVGAAMPTGNPVLTVVPAPTVTP